ncbi:MBG domain-containing protein [Dokdonella sp.]|uniref:MBG domain-containing protein n=1 Tax=Dokdonella sp. TaxID=2291710 RepID=UPI0027B95FDC|nr:MBG domain-containing protein [Dokdonella sp.]
MSSITVSAAARSVRSSTGLRVLPWLLAILAMPVLAADWYTSPGGNDGSSCASAGTPCQTIQAAINKAGANDTVHVGQGQYPFVATIQIAGTAKNGLKLIGDNSPFDAPIAPPTAPAPASNASELQAAGTSGHTGMIWVNGAQDVTIENLLLQVRHGRSNEGIVTTGNANGLVLRNNYLIINNNAGGKRNAISLNMTAGGNSDQNSTGVGPYSGIYVTLEGNVVQPSTAASGAVSARAVVGDDFAGVFRNNFLVGQTQDIRLRFLGNTAGGRGFTFEGNWVFGAGAWFLSFNDSTQTVYIRNNHFIAPGAPGYNVSPLTASTLGDPDFSSLKLVGATNPVIVEGNEFLGFARYYRGLWIQNWPGVTVQDNSFTPNPTYNGLSTALLIGNKEVWNGAPAPRQLAVSVLRNTFAAGYANANSRAIVFVDDNDASGTATAGSLLVGDGDTANANSFAAGLKWYIGLDEHTCNSTNCSTAPPTSSPLGPGINYTSGSNVATQGRPFPFDVNAYGNRYAGKLVDEMSNTEYSAIATKIYDDVDNSALGIVHYEAGPRITTGTIIFSPTSFTWDGSAHTISASLQEDNTATCVVTPASLTEPGSHPVSATCTSSTYNVTDAGTVTVAKAAGTVVWGTLGFDYDGSVQTVTATMNPGAVACTVTGTVGPDAGSYAVHADCADAHYAASDDASAVINRIAGTLAWGNLNHVYDGNAVTPTASISEEAGASCVFTPANVGPNVGDYPVSASCTSANYSASGSETVHITRAPGTLAWGNLNHVYEGNSVTPTASIIEEAGASCVFTPANVGPNAGDYPVSASCTSTNYSASGSETVHITRAPGTVAFGATNFDFDGSAHGTTAVITQEPGNSSACTLTPTGDYPRTHAGSTTLAASCTGTNYTASGSTTLTVAPKTVTLVLSGLGPIPYDGQPHAVSVTVSGEVAGFPAAVDVSYDGNAAAPIEVGSYAVIAALAASASDYAAAPVAGTLEITVGAAANIAIEGGASFTGIAGQTLSGALPSVKVTDIGAHPVAGVTVTFAAAPGNGSLGGAVQTTDANGIATLGGWTLSPTPGSNTATASAAGVSGTVSFLATGTADASALVVTIDDGRSATQVGRSLTWTIVVGNPRTSDTSVDVLDTLPPELDVGSAQWQCTPGNGASCSASGSGDLDDSINLPVGSSVTYLLTATVVDDIDGMITNTVSVSEGANTITRSDDTEIVIFRDGFEAGGDGAESVPESTQAKLVPLADLADGAALQLTLDADRLDPLRPVIVAQARDRAFAVEAMRIGELVQLRLARVGVRGESPGAWSRLDGNRFALLREGGRIALVGTREALTIALGRDGVVAVDGLVVP